MKGKKKRRQHEKLQFLQQNLFYTSAQKEKLKDRTKGVKTKCYNFCCKNCTLPRKKKNQKKRQKEENAPKLKVTMFTPKIVFCQRDRKQIERREEKKAEKRNK